MKITGIVVLILALIGCAAGLIVMSHSLGTTQDQLEQTKTSLTQAQLEQQSIASSLEETRNELQDTANSLEESRQGLEAQKKETDNYRQLYESTTEELKNTENEISYLEGELALTKQESQELQKQINELQDKLVLYEDTLGTHVYSGTMPPYHSGSVSQIILNNKASARNPTWEELLDFLEEDKTDKKLYVSGEYECGNFAQELHDNAESHGIRAAFVVVHFYEDLSHALNAFKTTDRGLVYIDDTGDIYKRYVANLDKQVNMAKDEVYTAFFLFPEYLALSQDDRKVLSIEIYW
jgi:septal ring factor EnvC (AmiA/AmiB activator)